jgi:2-oxoisovalerate dehydrogenase E2 component (dihydrolipoyl transacylase)
MSRYEFRLPDIGEGTAEAECVGWHVKLGDQVEEDQPVIDVMTDKATVEVTSPLDGTVVERHGEPGEMMQIGSVVLVFETNPEAVPSVIDIEVPVMHDQGEPLAAIASDGVSQGRVLTTPAVRQRAKDIGIDLAMVVGSGPRGRVRQSDVDAYEAYAMRSAPATTASDSISVPVLSSSIEDQVQEVPVIGLRRKIAERLQETKRRIPHFTYIEEVDLTALERARVALNHRFDGKRPKLTLLPFLLRALADTLPDFPHLNAHFDDAVGVVRQYRALHAGIATQTPRGLVVTVLRDAGDKSLWSLAEEIARLSDLARTGRAVSSDLSGSTLTVTSLGAMGGLATTPVINSPEVAIVGVNKLIDRAVVRGGAILIAKMMNLSSSFDHRVVDGWDAAAFIQHLKALLEEPALLLAE